MCSIYHGFHPNWAQSSHGARQANQPLYVSANSQAPKVAGALAQRVRQKHQAWWRSGCLGKGREGTGRRWKETGKRDRKG